MGTWGTGVLDNDIAMDFFDQLDDTAPGQRAAFIRQALLSAIAGLRSALT